MKRRCRRYTEDEILFIETHTELSHEEVAIALGRSINAILQVRSRRGLPMSNKKRKEVIEDVEKLAAKHGLTLAQVSNRIRHFVSLISSS